MSAMSSFVSEPISKTNTCHWKRLPTPSAIRAQMTSSFWLSHSYPCNRPLLRWTTKHRSSPIPMITRGNRTRPMLERTQVHTIRRNHRQRMPIPMDKNIRRTRSHMMDEPMRATTEDRPGRQQTTVGATLHQQWQQQRQVLVRMLSRRATQIMATHKRRWRCIINFINEENVFVRVFDTNGIEECCSIVSLHMFLVYIWHSDSVCALLSLRFWFLYFLLSGFYSNLFVFNRSSDCFVHLILAALRQIIFYSQSSLSHSYQSSFNRFSYIESH